MADNQSPLIGQIQGLLEKIQTKLGSQPGGVISEAASGFVDVAEKVRLAVLDGVAAAGAATAAKMIEAAVKIEVDSESATPKSVANAADVAGKLSMGVAPGLLITTAVGAGAVAGAVPAAVGSGMAGGMAGALGGATAGAVPASLIAAALYAPLAPVLGPIGAVAGAVPGGVAGAGLGTIGGAALGAATGGLVGGATTGALTAVFLADSARRGAEDLHKKVDAAVDEALKERRYARRRPRLSSDSIDLDSVYSQVVPGSWMMLSLPDHSELFRVAHVTEAARSDFALKAKTTRVTLEGRGLRGEYKLTSAALGALEGDGVPEPVRNQIAELTGSAFQTEEEFSDALYLKIESRDDLAQHGSAIVKRAAHGKFDRETRDTVVHADSYELQLGQVPVIEPLSGAQLKLEAGAGSLPAGRRVIVTGKLWSATASPGPDDPLVSELAIVKRAIAGGDFTDVELEKPLQHTYASDTVSVRANLVRATHGETVHEILGSGDAGRARQSFALRQAPLTYVNAATASGVVSTLTLRVNGVEWREGASLYGRGPRERVFVARTSDEGRTTLQFGDGAEGSRLPGGQDNVRAIYRKGIGAAGMVKAGQLSLLAPPPLGVKAVSNPLDAEGGADGEARDAARRNAPLTVLTLERAVSLRDYEDFARGYAGVAKALATWLWDGAARTVMLTIAGPDGARIAEDGELWTNLLRALRGAGDPHVRIRLKEYRRARFGIEARVRAARDRLPAEVGDSLRRRFVERFSFDARDFGQPVTLSEVMAAMQAVEGVAAVDIDRLYRKGRPRVLNQRLRAFLPEPGARGNVAAAELLTLDPAALKLKVGHEF